MPNQSQRASNHGASSSTFERYLLPGAIISAAAIGIVMAIGAPVNGDDASFHLHWIRAFYDLLREGVWLPKWVPDGFHGFGAPTFYFYPPLTYYVSSLVVWTTSLQRPETVFNVVGLISTVASGASCFYLLRRLDATQWNAFLGSLFYAFAPYRQFDLYSRSSLSQPMGFVFLPLILAGCIGVVQSQQVRIGLGRYTPSLLLTIGWAGLLLSAFPLSVAAGMTLLVLWFAFRKVVKREHVIRIGESVLLGMGLVAFQYLPSLHFMKFTQVNTYLNIPDGNWVPALLHGTQVRFVVQDMLIYFSQIALLIWYWRSYGRTAAPLVSRGIIIVLAFWVIIATPYLSSPLWNYVPVFHLLRFHARFSIFVVLTLAVLGFSSGEIELFWNSFARRIISAWSIIAILLSVTVIFRIQAHSHETSLWMDPPEYLPANTVPAKFAMDSLFLPHINDPLFVNFPSFTSTESVQLIRKSSRNMECLVSVEAPHRMTFHQFVWPEWKCILDGQETIPQTDSIGRMVILLKPGRYPILLQLVTSIAEQIGNWISSVSFVLLIVFGIKSAKREKHCLVQE